MKVLLFSITITIFSLPAFADFSGYWSGKVRLSINGDEGTECRAQLNIEHESNRLSLTEDSEIICGGTAVVDFPPSYSIRGHELWHADRRIGTINATRIHALYQGSELTVVDMEQNADQTEARFTLNVHLKDWGGQNNILEFKGTLRKLPLKEDQ